MANVIDVAEYILSKTKAISTWKLQKLVYYSQAWHCVWEDKALFKAKIEAWTNGPVCRRLYERHQGIFTIATIDGDVSRLRQNEKESIDAVLKTYDKFNGQQLSDLIHNEGPWKEARKGLGPGDRGENEITLESMNRYYSSL